MQHPAGANSGKTATQEAQHQLSSQVEKAVPVRCLFASEKNSFKISYKNEKRKKCNIFQISEDSNPRKTT